MSLYDAGWVRTLDRDTSAESEGPIVRRYDKALFVVAVLLLVAATVELAVLL